MLCLACGRQDSDPTDSQGPGEAKTTRTRPFGADDVGFGSLLAQIRGHHLVARELYSANDAKGALVHAGHPIAEILASVKSELQTHYASVAASLEDSLHAPAENIRQEGSTAELESALGRAATITDAAEAAVVGDASTSTPYKASVVSSLLRTATEEYREALGPGNEVTLLIEYQDAHGFVTEARRLYDRFAPEVERRSRDASQRIETAFGDLDEALPSLKPPERSAPAFQVLTAVDVIQQELVDAVDAMPLETAEPAAVVAEIERLLERLLTAYRSGRADQAAELAAEAFIEKYHLISAEVADRSPEINRRLVRLLGRDLRSGIDTRAPEDDIERSVQDVRDLLSEALRVLEAHPDSHS